MLNRIRGVYYVLSVIIYKTTWHSPASRVPIFKNFHFFPPKTSLDSRGRWYEGEKFNYASTTLMFI